MCNKYVINVNNANNHENTQRSMRNSYVSLNPPWRSHTPWVSCRDQRSRRSLPAEGPSRSEAQRQSSDARQQQPTQALQDAAIYLDDQVNIWRGVGDGKDGGPGQGGGIHVRSVRLQERFKLLRVEIIVKVLRYLQGREGGGQGSKVKHFIKTGSVLSCYATSTTSNTCIPTVPHLCQVPQVPSDLC